MDIKIKILIGILVVVIISAVGWRVIIAPKFSRNPQRDCLETCRCMKECNKEGPLYFIPVEEGSSECSVNSVNKTCCCSGV